MPARRKRRDGARSISMPGGFLPVVGPLGGRARPPGGLNGLLTEETAIRRSRRRHLRDNDAKGGRSRMRRILLLAAALTAFTVVGLAAAGKPASVSISAARPAVVYGSWVKLSGTISSRQAGEHVL